MTPDLDPNSDAKILQIFLQSYCQAKVQVQVKSQSSQVQRKSQKESRTWTLLTLWSSPPPYNLMHSP